MSNVRRRKELPLKIHGIPIGTAIVFDDGAIESKIHSGIPQWLIKDIFGDEPLSMSIAQEV